MPIEERVTELLGLANYAVRRVSLQPKFAGCSLEVLKSTSTGVASQTIACLEDSSQLNHFLRFAVPPKGSWVVVCDENPPSISPGTFNIIKKRKMHVLTLTLFYDEMLRAKEICKKTLEAVVRWKDEDINLERLSELYVPQRASIEQNSHTEDTNDSNEFLTSAFQTTAGAVIFVLADAGRGKTWLTWAIAQKTAKRYLDAVSQEDKLPKLPPPPVPFIIPFSQYKRLASFNGIVLERLNSIGTLDIRAEGFKYLLSKGRIVLILDGFDEMLELAPAHARENLVEISRHLQDLSKLVLTSRRTIFSTKSEITNFLSSAEGDPTNLNLSVCYLRGFTQGQLHAFHKARGATDVEIEKILKLPLDRELQEAPQIAEYFVDIVRSGIELKHQNVFEPILSLIYKREASKWEKDPNTRMPADLQEKFLTEISLLMWPDGAAAPQLAELLADDLGHRYLSKHHLLQPTLDGQLQFEHHVWRDWFMARALRERMEQSGWAPRVLSGLMANALPEYCANFLAINISREKLEAALQDSSLSDSSYSNLVRVAISQISQDASPSSRAADLAKYLGSVSAFKFRRLEKITFQRFDLRGWAFDQTTFTDAFFSFCTLPRTFQRELMLARGVNVSDCELWPQEAEAKEILERAKRKLHHVLKKFIWSTDPARVRNEISEEQMTREFHISAKDEALRCLIRLGYVHSTLQASSKQYYVLETNKLNDLLRFIKGEVDLEDVTRCIVG